MQATPYPQFTVTDTQYKEVDLLMSEIKRRLVRPHGSLVDPDELLEVLRYLVPGVPRRRPRITIPEIPPSVEAFSGEPWP